MILNLAAAEIKRENHKNWQQKLNKIHIQIVFRC